jgi:hypothetical protein
MSYYMETMTICHVQAVVGAAGGLLVVNKLLEIHLMLQ